MPAQAAARYVFRHSRAKTIAGLVFVAAFALLTLPTGLMLGAVIGAVAYVVTAVWALLLAALAHHLWRQLRNREPVLVLDAQGLVDHRLPGPPIPWRSLARIDHSTLRSSQVMTLTFVDRETADAVFGLSRSLDALTMGLENLFTGARPHAAIELSSLGGSPRRAVKIAQALHARATRRG